MSPLVSRCLCPNKLCGAFIVVEAHPPAKKSYKNNTWTIVCHKCSQEFDVPDSEIMLESVSDQWLREYPRT